MVRKEGKSGEERENTGEKKGRKCRTDKDRRKRIDGKGRPRKKWKYVTRRNGFVHLAKKERRRK